MVKFLAFEKLKRATVRELIERLSFIYDCKTEHLLKYHFYTTNKDKVYISTVDVKNLDLKRINAIGMYFGTFHDNDRFRLSLEGSKLLKPKKNKIILNEKSFKSYIEGENLFRDEVEGLDLENNAPFLIVEYNGENLGSMSVKDDILLTYLPKSRKLDYNKVF